MKVAFEFDGATPEQVASVFEEFYSKFASKPICENGVEVDSIIIGKINFYISIKCKESGNFVTCVVDGKEINWHVKKPAKDPKKPRKRQIYENQELGYVICE
jgi:hypothetical protein